MPLYPDGEMWDIHDDTPNRKLYTFEEITMQGVKCFGYQEHKKAGIGTPWHYHKNCFEFHYVIDGATSFRVGDEDYMIKSGHVFMTFPNEFHGNGDNPFTRHKLYWFSLSDEGNILGLDPLWSQLIIGRLKNFKHRLIPVRDEMKDLIMGVYKNIVSKDEYNQRYTSSQMLLFLHKLIESESIMENPRLSKEVKAAITYMQNNINENVSLTQVAQAAGLSLSYFKAKFKKETNISPANYYLNLQINEAKKLLRKGYSVTNTAYELNFCSSNYFSTVFRRVTFLTPTQYIQKNNARENPQGV